MGAAMGGCGRYNCHVALTRWRAVGALAAMAVVVAGCTEASTTTTEPVPQSTVSTSTIPETTIPETTVPETTVPETTVPQSAGAEFSVAACTPTGSGDTSGEVDGIAWSVRIWGEPPNLRMESTINGHFGGRSEWGPDSWGHHSLDGSWDWDWYAGEVNVLSGLVPFGSTARVRLEDGSTVLLCSVGTDLGHEVAYAAGALSRSAEIVTVELVDADDVLIGEAPTYQFDPLPHPAERDVGGTLGFQIWGPKEMTVTPGS